MNRTRKALTLKQSVAAPVALALLSVSIAGCGGQDSDQPEAGDTQEETATVARNPIYDNKPVTIKIYTGTSDDEWPRYFEEPIRKKFPNVTLVRQIQQKVNLAELVAAGDAPDIIQATPNVFASQIFTLGLQYDLTEMIKTYKYDTGRFIPELMDSIRAYADKGQIYGIPAQSTLYGLLYNKELFDKFAVSYPKGGMTWDETIELARRLSRSDGGIQYRGLDVQGPLQLYAQLSLNPITKDNKALVTTEPWQKAADVFKRIYEVPGNNREITGGIANYYQPFFDSQVAMLAISLIRMISAAQQFPDLKWDVVPFPTFKEAPDTDPLVNYVMSGVSSTSKVKDEAFEIITYLVSDEVQKQFVRKGFITPLKNPEVQKLLGEDVPTLKGKNLPSVYQHKQTTVIFSKYQNSRVDGAINNAFNNIRKGTHDINTALRGAEEAINKEIATQMAQ